MAAATRVDLDYMIGPTRESITVALGELTSEGYVKLARRQVFICDLAALAASVEANPPDLERGSSGNLT